MKKLLLLTFSVCSLFCYGQHVIQSSTNSPRLGDNVVKQEVPYFSSGLPGDDVMWDFSMLDPIRDYPIEYFCDTDSVVLKGIEPEIMYKYVSQIDTLKLIGYENPQTYMCYTEPVVLLTYPFSYGDSLRTFFRGIGVYCLKNGIRTRGSVSVDADAYGSIILPDDTINDVLRLHVIKSGSVNMNILSDTTVFDPDNLKQEIEERYQWYARGYRYPLFETISTSYYNNMEYISSYQKAYACFPAEQHLLGDSINEEIMLKDSVSCGSYDNVGENDIIHYSVETNGSNVIVNYDLDSSANITSLICNQMGFVFRRNSVFQSAGDDYSLNIDCSGLRKGVYILYLNVNGKIYNEKINLK